MSALADLITARELAATRLKEAVSVPKPSYTLGDESYEWGEYQEMLQRQIDSLTATIQKLGGPYRVIRRGKV